MLFNIITTALARYFHIISLQEQILNSLSLILFPPKVKNNDPMIMFIKHLRQWRNWPGLEGRLGGGIVPITAPLTPVGNFPPLGLNPWFGASGVSRGCFKPTAV